MEVDLNHLILKENVKIMVPADCEVEELMETLSKHVDNILPIVIYAVYEEVLNDNVSQKIGVLRNQKHFFSFLEYSRNS